MIKNSLIGIIDHRFANLHSVKKALDYLECPNTIINNPDKLTKVDALILPGVGAFDAAMSTLNNSGFVEPIKATVSNGIPLLGVCLGMQLLFSESEEGNLPGFDLIKGKVTEIKKVNEEMKIPHMGWNSVTLKTKSILFNNIIDEEYFYFVHGYKCEPSDKSVVTSITNYGEEICSSIENNSIFATQFHPEKSGKNGLEVYKNFILKVGSI